MYKGHYGVDKMNTCSWNISISISSFIYTCNKFIFYGYFKFYQNKSYS